MYTNNWLSYHIFIHDFTEHDRFIKQFLYPYIQKNSSITAFFFIRYWQGGPHIRFRCKAADGEAIRADLQEQVQLFSQQYSPKQALTPELFYENHSFDGVQPDSKDLYWMPDLHVANISYVPEFDRYGEGECMVLSEKVFEQSSRAAGTALLKIPDNHLLLKTALAYTVFQQVDRFVQGAGFESLKNTYKDFWQFQKKDHISYDKIWSRLKHFWQQDPAANEKWEKVICEEAVQSFQHLLGTASKVSPLAFRYIVMSQLHMFNNRIGLPPEFEWMMGVDLPIKKGAAV